MKIITLEEHFMNEAIAIASAKAMETLSPSFRAAYSVSNDPTAPELTDIFDLDEKRLAYMDKYGIDMQVLSYTSPGTQLLAPELAVSLAQLSNDEMAAAVQKYPTRFAAFANLPTPDPEAAAKELERAVQQLGFKGVMINGRTNNRTLESPEFDPILATAQSLGVPIYLHPAIPSRVVQDEYYEGFDPIVSTRFATAAMGWHYETGVHAVRMILGGVFDRYPKLQVILGHWGEMLPSYLDRMDDVLSTVANNLTRSVAECFTQNFYVTPSGMFSIPNLQMAMAVLGADRIMFSVDYPYVSASGAREFLDNAPLAPADKHKIAHTNAERLLNL